MKKFLIILVSMITVCGILYGFLAPHMQAGNFLPKEEYNNNKNSSDEGVRIMNTPSPLNKDTNKKHDAVAVNAKITPTAIPIDTQPDSYTVLVNKEYPLPEDYIPNDLVVPDVLFNINYYHEKKLMRQDAATALEHLFQDAELAGLSLNAISGYRSYTRQKEIYDNNVRTKGLEATNLVSAMPGYSEHQTGLSIDVSTPSIANRLEEVFAGTPEGKWLAKNASNYGFIIRYPKDKSEITGYSYEPWHIRYVGKELAKYLSNQNLSLEEYYNYEPSHDLLQDHDYGNIIDVEDHDLPEEEKSTPLPETNKPKLQATKSPATPAPTEATNTKTPQPSAPVPTKKPPVSPSSPKDTPLPTVMPTTPATSVEETPIPVDQQETVTPPPVQIPADPDNTDAIVMVTPTPVPTQVPATTTPEDTTEIPNDTLPETEDSFVVTTGE